MIREERWMGVSVQTAYSRCTLFILVAESLLALLLMTTIVVSFFYTQQMSPIDKFVFKKDNDLSLKQI